MEVSKEKIEKIAEFIDEDCIDCDRCPAHNKCLKLKKSDCKDNIVKYLKGE